jgi:hypothetical protein
MVKLMMLKHLKIARLQKNFEKLEHIFNILQNNKELAGNNTSNQHIKNALVLVNNSEKTQYLLNDIDSSKYILKLPKYDNTENHLVDITNKINKEFQNKQNQFIDAYKHFRDVSPLPHP